MSDNEKIASTLGELLFKATRTSISQGAMYDPGEHISTDAKGAWEKVAEILVKLVDAKIAEKTGAPAPGGELPETTT